METGDSIDILLRMCISSTRIMEYYANANRGSLARRSMLVMTGDARYLYKHSISKDLVETSSEGVTVHRDRRVSFTFRGTLAHPSL